MTKKAFHEDYFEAKIQLRPATEETLRFIKNRVRERESVFISKTEELKEGGVDIYLSSQRYAQTIGRGLKKSFGGEFKISRTLHTLNKMTSKKVYRVTVLFRPRMKEE
ncbi:MAG: hypothetical protein KKA65_02095 [Nanoarchaeota archaeon]|nr:hypothetical protein [Nanoarchaeota archaeon]MBU4352357.1 hypothetical protein [Nanoarchaeota archaeon]MBU4456268.1 hypothetical protein [Nanoarchaeota archaeon]MCG2720383.1 hypothetical protein [Nanoarchaeota archaeon]